MRVYLFVLCPPYSGSTILWKLLATSSQVSSLPSEGQFLPELEPIMRDKPWVKEHRLPWDTIKAAWEQHWDQQKPVLLEKSPPNIIRTAEIVQHFKPVKFVIMVRNPYAHAEGLMRRNDWNATRAARFSMMCLGTQLENRRNLEDTLVLTYESLVADPSDACTRLQEFMPELGALDATASFEVHSVDGVVDRPITDLNSKKIESLDRATLAEMNAVFSEHQHVFDGWNYELLDPENAQVTAPGGWAKRLMFWQRG